MFYKYSNNVNNPDKLENPHILYGVESKYNPPGLSWSSGQSEAIIQNMVKIGSHNNPYNPNNP